MVKDEQDILWMLNEIEGSSVPLDDYMKGYVKALQWVTNGKTLAQEIEENVGN